jgi:hypothetical protein
MEIVMVRTAPTLHGSFWRRMWQFLRELDEAVHTTPKDLLDARVGRLERELMELKGSPSLHSSGKVTLARTPGWGERAS